MSADIEKLAVFDSRIIQSRPKFAVMKGALSQTNAPFNAISATTSQHTYNIYVPSENVFVDRAVEWTSTCFNQATITYAAVPGPNVPLAVIGKDIALTAFPLNSLCSTLTATINDTTVTINSQDVLKEILRLSSYSKDRAQRTCPTYLDNYLAYADGAGCINTPLGSYSNATGVDYVPNGAFNDFVFTDANGADLVGSGTYAGFINGAPANISYVNGVPVSTGTAGQLSYSLYFRWRSTEKIVLSPFVFADCHEWDTGLFGINNIQLIMNLRDPGRLLRFDTTGGKTLTAVQYNTGVTGGVFQNSVVNTIFLTPSLDVELPPKSSIPYLEYPRYISTPGSALAGTNTVLFPSTAPNVAQIQSQTITLPQIPDMILVYVKALKSGANPDPSLPQFADGYLSVATKKDGIRNPLTVNFDNFSGLLSSHTAEQLYAMCVKNGLEMDWGQWSGSAQVAGAGAGLAGAVGAKVGMTGGPLVLAFGEDITLQAGQAPSLVGNFTLQLSLQVKNNYAFEVIPQMYIVTVNSGFFESIRGSSRIIKGVLSEQAIISAPMAGMGGRTEMARLVGAGFMSKLGNALSKAKEIYQATKPAVSALRSALPEGQVKSALGMAGYGMEGMGMGAGTGAGTGAARASKKSLAARLM